MWRRDYVNYLEGVHPFHTFLDLTKYSKINIVIGILLKVFNKIKRNRMKIKCLN